MTTPAAPTRQDPIRKRFFAAVERGEKASDVLFWIAVGLSFAVVLAPGSSWAAYENGLQIAFIVTVGSMFFLGLGLRLFWTPRAEDERRRDFLSNTFGVSLTLNQTTGYYNNSQTDPLHRLAANTMENSLFTRTITGRMAVKERVWCALYGLVFAVAVLYRESALGFIAVIAQTLLSEQILSRWWRVEWLRGRSERTFDGLHALFLHGVHAASFEAKAVEWLLFYENSKANAGLTLPSSIFDEVNPSLTAEWEDIKQKLNIS